MLLAYTSIALVMESISLPMHANVDPRCVIWISLCVGNKLASSHV